LFCEQQKIFVNNNKKYARTIIVLIFLSLAALQNCFKFDPVFGQWQLKLP